MSVRCGVTFVYAGWLHVSNAATVSHILPARRPARRSHVAVLGRGGDLDGRDAVLQLLLPAAGRHPHDRRSAELGCAGRISCRQPGREQPVGGRRARAPRGRRAPRRTGAALRPEPRCPRHHRQPRGDVDAGARDRPPVRPGVRDDCPAATRRVGRLRRRRARRSTLDSRELSTAFAEAQSPLEFDAYARAPMRAIAP